MVYCPSKITCLSRWAPGIQDMVLALGHPSTFNATGTVSSEKVKFKIQCCRICFITETKHQLSYLSQLSVTDELCPNQLSQDRYGTTALLQQPPHTGTLEWQLSSSLRKRLFYETRVFAALWAAGLQCRSVRHLKQNRKLPYVGFNAFMK